MHDGTKAVATSVVRDLRSDTVSPVVRKSHPTATVTHVKIGGMAIQIKTQGYLAKAIVGPNQ